MYMAKTIEELIENSVNVLAHVFVGDKLGVTGTAENIHPEIRDEIRLELRHAFASALEYGAEKLHKVCNSCGDETNLHELLLSEAQKVKEGEV